MDARSQTRIPLAGRYPLERLFVAAVMALAVTGFWNLYFGADARPTGYHHLHVATVAVWLSLLWLQLGLIGSGRPAAHRTLGLSVLAVAPLLVAAVALLSVHSAQKGLASGRGDFMIVQNVGVTLELALLILAAFAVGRRRKLHGALMLGTAMLFMGIALFFTLVGFVPAFRIEGPETFHRFEAAGATGRYACLAVGAVFFLKDPRHGWPVLLAGAFFTLNEQATSVLAKHGLIDPLTRFVGSLDPALAFAGTFLVFAALLAALVLRRPAADPRPAAKRPP